MTYRANPDYILRTIAGENVLVSTGAGVADFTGVITLNGTAAFLWKKLQTGATETQLAEALLEEYELTEEQAAEDVQALLEMLVGRRMVTNEQ